jgi:hypothetical protein
MIAAIYAIQVGEDGPIKVGATANLQRRLSNLQCSSPTPLRLVDSLPFQKGLERRLHNHLRGHHVRGEWFRSAPDVVAAFDRVRAGGAKALASPKPRRSFRRPRKNMTITPLSVVDSIFTAFDPNGAGSTKISEATGWPISTIHSWKTARSIPEWRRENLLEAAYREGVQLSPEAIRYLDPEGKVPAQLSFQAPPPPPGSPSVEAMAGANRAEAKAERAVTGWAETAYTYLRGYAARHSRFLAEEVRAAAAADGVAVPPAPGAWGNVFKRAARAKLIERSGYAPSKLASTHGKAAVVWIVP